LIPPALVEALRAARSVGVITGAGISAESGIQTYRGQGGLYDDPEEGDRTVEALTGTTLAADPDRTWRAVAKLARQARGARPNAGHFAITALEKRVGRFVLLTQNVDGLHAEAGSRNVIDIHGDIFATVCMDCGARGSLTREEYATIDATPACPSCRGRRRPDVVLFGEMLPVDKLARLQREFERDVPDVVLSVGTSSLFPYIQMPVLIARRAGKTTVEVNPGRTDLSDFVDFRLQGRAGEVLPALVSAL
jgi:NAD-dependent deacetylase